MYSPAEVARRYVETGKSKAALPVGRMLLLGMLAGAFIALAGGSATFAVSYGGRLAGAAVFPAGLAMVLLAGNGRLFWWFKIRRCSIFCWEKSSKSCKNCGKSRMEWN